MRGSKLTPPASSRHSSPASRGSQSPSPHAHPLKDDDSAFKPYAEQLLCAASPVVAPRRHQRSSRLSTASSNTPAPTSPSSRLSPLRRRKALLQRSSSMGPKATGGGGGEPPPAATGDLMLRRGVTNVAPLDVAAGPDGDTLTSPVKLKVDTSPMQPVKAETDAAAEMIAQVQRITSTIRARASAATTAANARRDSIASEEGVEAEVATSPHPQRVHTPIHRVLSEAARESSADVGEGVAAKAAEAEQLEAAVGSLQADVATAAAREEVLSAEVQEMQAGLCSLQTELAAVTKEELDGASQLGAAKQERLAAARTLADRQGTRTAAREDTATMQAAMTHLAQLLGSRETDWSAAEDTERATQAKVASLTRGIAKARSREKAAGKRSAAAKERGVALRARVEALRAERAALVAEARDLQAELSGLEGGVPPGSSYLMPDVTDSHPVYLVPPPAPPEPARHPSATSVPEDLRPTPHSRRASSLSMGSVFTGLLSDATHSRLPSLASTQFTLTTTESTASRVSASVSS